MVERISNIHFLFAYLEFKWYASRSNFCFSSYDIIHNLFQLVKLVQLQFLGMLAVLGKDLVWVHYTLDSR